MNKYEKVDMWWCSKCKITWLVPAIPHNGKCPKCGEGGWWQGFASPVTIEHYAKRMADMNAHSRDA